MKRKFSSEKKMDNQSTNEKNSISDYENQRLKRIEDNKKRMEALGLHKLASSYMGFVQKTHKKSNKETGRRKKVDEDEEYNPTQDGNEMGTSAEEDDSDDDFFQSKRMMAIRGAHNGKRGGRKRGEGTCRTNIPSTASMAAATPDQPTEGPVLPNRPSPSLSMNDGLTPRFDQPSGGSILPNQPSPSSSAGVGLVRSQNQSPMSSPSQAPTDHTGPPTSSSVAGSSFDSQLQQIEVDVAARRLIPSNTCSRKITKIFKNMFQPAGYTWRDLTDDTIDTYFEEFQKYFKWDSQFDKVVRDIWEDHASVRYSDTLSKWKKRGRKPKCLSEEVWRDLLRYWSLPEVVTMSERQSRNRMSEVDGPGTGPSRHIGGSRSAVDLHRKLTKENGHAPSEYDLFLHLHMKPAGAFVDERSRNINEKVNVARTNALKRPEGSTEPPIDPSTVDMSKLFLEVARNKKKPRIYGIGCKSTSFFGSRAGPSASATSGSPVDPELMRKQITEEVQQQFQVEVNAIKDQFKQEQQLRDAEIQQMKLLIQQLMGGVEFPIVQPPTGTRPPSSGSSDDNEDLEAD